MQGQSPAQARYRREAYSFLVRATTEDPYGRRSHALRVYDLARLLGEGRRVDDDVLYCAAMLHDVGAYPEYARPGVDHAERSAQLTATLLPAWGFPAAKIPACLEAVRHHMHRSPPGEGLEAVLLREADTLDFLGLVGVIRALARVGLDHRVPDIPAALERVEVLHQRLPAKLVTPAGRKLAAIKTRHARSYLDAIRCEAGDSPL